jgi:hypothetical protein
MPYSWFYFDLVKNVSREKTFHSCQIPQKLSELLIKSCTQPGDVVLVLFAGSGSEVAVCRNIDRHFISAEIDETYYKMILERLKNQGEVPQEYRLFTRQVAVADEVRQERLRDFVPQAFEQTIHEHRVFRLGLSSTNGELIPREDTSSVDYQLRKRRRSNSAKKRK